MNEICLTKACFLSELFMSIKHMHNCTYIWNNRNELMAHGSLFSYQFISVSSNIFPLFWIMISTTRLHTYPISGFLVLIWSFIKWTQYRRFSVNASYIHLMEAQFFFYFWTPKFMKFDPKWAKEAEIRYIYIFLKIVELLLFRS